MNAASFVAWMAALTTMAAANARMEWDEFQEDVPVEKDFLTEAELKIVNDFRKLMMEKALATKGFKNKCEITFNKNHETTNYAMRESIVYRIRFDEKKEVEDE